MTYNPVTQSIQPVTEQSQNLPVMDNWQIIDRAVKDHCHTNFVRLNTRDWTLVGDKGPTKQWQTGDRKGPCIHLLTGSKSVTYQLRPVTDEQRNSKPPVTDQWPSSIGAVTHQWLTSDRVATASDEAINEHWTIGGRPVTKFLPAVTIQSPTTDQPLINQSSTKELLCRQIAY